MTALPGFKIPNDQLAGDRMQEELHEADLQLLAHMRMQEDGLYGVLKGCAPSAANNQTVVVASGQVLIASAVVAVATGSNPTLAAADATNPRYDLVTIDSSGTKGSVAGTAAANPMKPDIPASKVVIAEVFRAANDNTIGSGEIIDKRMWTPPQALPGFRDLVVPQAWAGFQANTNAISYAANEIRLVRCVVPRTGTLTDISFFVSTAAGNYSLAAYDMGESSAGNYSRLVTSGSTALALPGGVAGWVTFSPSQPVYAGQTIMLALSLSSATAVVTGFTTNNGSLYQLPSGFLAVPANTSAKLAGKATTAHPAPSTISEANMASAGSGSMPLLIARIS